MFEVSSDIYFIVYYLYYTDQNNNLGTRARPIHRDGGSILGRPFLRNVGAIIDMKEGTIKYQFPLNKGMEHLPRKRRSYLLILLLEKIMILMLFHSKILDSHFLRLAQRR
jgi:hypothetical protein